jgi:protein-L-isoaspartate(D-aspartate) O-methyltransferase
MNCRWILLLSLFWPACTGVPGNEPKTSDDESRYRLMREKMVISQIERRGVNDPRVLKALRSVPRHAFVPKHLTEQAYDDNALPIGEDQTISQPYVVAVMTQSLELRGSDRVLEIGTGSGYQAAVLAELVHHVFTIEIVESLAKQAKGRLGKIGYENITPRTGDGYGGWPDESPFDAIIVTAAPDHIPQALVAQLKVGGKMVIPVGDFEQQLMLLTKQTDGSVKEKRIIPVRFVPMTGEALER